MEEFQALLERVLIATVLFGNTASPFCVQFVIHTHAQSHKETFPEAAESVDNSMYVDDV
jgi:hypothetical protein